MKRPKSIPDTRPHWSDPDLPCIRDYRMIDGSRKTEVDPDYERRYREHLMQISQHPSWKQDPTYHMKRKDKPNG